MLTATVHAIREQAMPPIRLAFARLEEGPLPVFAQLALAVRKEAETCRPSPSRA